jgi:hypothetical protein
MPEIQPMKEEELGKYVCVARGGCKLSPYRTIYEDGVWVQYRNSGGPPSHVYSSAHRHCVKLPVNVELFNRSAPAWNCVDYPNDGMHYVDVLGDGSCFWCGMSRTEMAQEWADRNVD